MSKLTCKTDANGTKHWYLNDKLHREDGPAIEYADGTKYWWLNGKLHREDGPAVEYADGGKYWWLNGKKLTQEEYQAYQNKQRQKILLTQRGKNQVKSRFEDIIL